MLFHIIRLKNYPIFEQLLLEEQLLREDDRNFCLLNEGTPPAIVMGISGKPHELINYQEFQQRPCPVIKRFSGGGTVFVDENTLFVTWICNKAHVDIVPYPERILKWSESLYKPALEIPDFALKDNDFVIQNTKCGGNAQYITKNRFLQHTSFLWDFSPKNMNYLLHPSKTPPYREGREHKDFLCTLKEHFPEKSLFSQKIETHIKQNYNTMPLLLQDILPKNARISTNYLNICL